MGNKVEEKIHFVALVRGPLLGLAWLALTLGLRPEQLWKRQSHFFNDQSMIDRLIDVFLTCLFYCVL